MRQKFFTLVSALSLLLCLATVALSAWSFHVAEIWASGSRDSRVEAHQIRVIASRGVLVLERSAIRVVSTTEDDVSGSDDISEKVLSSASNPGSGPVAPPPEQEDPDWRYAGGFGSTHRHMARIQNHDTSNIEWQDYRKYFVPFWSIGMLSAVAPMVWMWLFVFIPTQRHCSGLCPACAYNLTGNTSGVCPECGMAIIGH
ncbi:MAG TPA: hypothetical protein VIM11_02465 [Tepidisphaeraceae bacterium]